MIRRVTRTKADAAPADYARAWELDTPRAPVLGIVGPSGSGKTLLMEALVREFSDRGVRVGAVKHAAHGFHLDVSGKDSHRLQDAGALRVVVVGPEGMAVWAQGAELTLERALGEVQREGLDLVLVEGFKGSHHLKVELAPDDRSLLAPEQAAEVLVRLPAIASPAGAKEAALGLADMIRARLVDNRPPVEASVLVNGTPIPLGNFVTKAIAGMVLGMVHSLKGGEEATEVEVRVRLRRPEGTRLAQIASRRGGG